jgi:hypothetical protein
MEQDIRCSTDLDGTRPMSFVNLLSLILSQGEPLVTTTAEPRGSDNETALTP